VVERVKKREPRAVTAAYLQQRENILDAAGAVFYEKSYHAATMQDIADRAGILKAGLYYYFRSKEDILFELSAGEESVRRVENYITVDAALEDQSPPSRLQTFVRLWMESTAAARNPKFVAVEREYRQLSPPRLKETLALRRRLPSLLESIIRSGVDSGHFRKNINVSVTAKNISAILTDLFVWYRADGPAAVTDLIEWHLEFIMAGLAGELPTNLRPYTEPAIKDRGGSDSATAKPA
jgi:TetR/AcrR family transcriptional regulator, cholesterol catabolism regulator